MATIVDFFSVFLGHVGAVVQPQLKARLIQLGVESLEELPPDVARSTYADAIKDTTLLHAHNRYHVALGHLMTSFDDMRTRPAFARINQSVKQPYFLTQSARGIDAAVTLAALGLRVAPLAEDQSILLSAPSNNVAIVFANFAAHDAAEIAYLPCSEPFYFFFTDCIVTAKRLIATRPEMRDFRAHLKRTKFPWPEGRFNLGSPAYGFVARQPGDRVGSRIVRGTKPGEGSVGLLAGWTEDGKDYGRDGTDYFLPVPHALISALFERPDWLRWLWHNGEPAPIVH